MKKSLIIPSLSFAILLVVVIVGEATESQPLPVVALPAMTGEQQHAQDPEVIIEKKKAQIAKSIEQHTRVSDKALADAARNTKAYSREQYEKTLANQESAEVEITTIVEDEVAVSKVESAPVIDAKASIKKVVQKTQQQRKEQKTSNAETKTAQTQEVDPLLSVTITVVGGGSYDLSVPVGSTVEAAMSAATEQGLAYTTKLYPGIGSYVTSMNGVSEDTRAGMYWIYYVNGAKAQAGISSTVVSDGDVILWRLEKGSSILRQAQDDSLCHSELVEL